MRSTSSIGPSSTPRGSGEAREDKLRAYRQARDQIRARMIARFGPPTQEDAR